MLCLDSHVILTDDSLKRLYSFIQKPRNRFCRDLHYGVNLADDHKQFFSHLDIWGPDKKPLIGVDGVFGNWRSDPRAKTPDGKPFDVEGGGGWCFFARRDAFLSVGFHPLMRGFGGEEGFVAERFRRAERRVKCAPFVRGIHRYARITGDVYPVTQAEKLRNHVIGWQDLGFDLEQLRTVWHGRLKPEEIDQVIARSVAEFQAFAAAGQKPAAGAAPVAAAPAPAVTPAAEAVSIEEVYRKNCENPSDINEHLPTLRRLATECDSVVEFGTRTGVSLSALLAAQPKRLVSYDLTASCACNRLKKLARGTVLEYRHGPNIGDTLTVPPIDPAGLLFIDSKHTADQVYAELSRHGDQVNRYLAFHDVSSFGDRGEGWTEAAPVAGILVGIDRWILERPGQWEQVEWHGNNNGLMVLKRIAPAGG